MGIGSLLFAALMGFAMLIQPCPAPIAEIIAGAVVAGAAAGFASCAADSNNCKRDLISSPNSTTTDAASSLPVVQFFDNGTCLLTNLQPKAIQAVKIYNENPFREKLEIVYGKAAVVGPDAVFLSGYNPVNMDAALAITG